jgi:type II secretory pathway predicted ATPase ExeA
VNAKNQLVPYGLKWNPFSQELPIEGILPTPLIESFCDRVESLTRDGGFALVVGETGSGKSSALRLLFERLARQDDLRVGVLSRPQSTIADFYREMGDLFDVKLAPHNRWGGTKVLRERWRSHIDTTLSRPTLLVDEAQEMLPAVLNELRLLGSTDLDSRNLLTVVLAGDARLTAKFRSDDLVPLGSRIRIRLNLEPMTSVQLADSLRQAIAQAGNSQLMTDELIRTLADHAAGNRRTLMSMAWELLEAATAGNIPKLDEKLYFEVFSSKHSAPLKREAASDRSRRGTR